MSDVKINKFEVNGQEVLFDESKLTELSSEVGNYNIVNDSFSISAGEQTIFFDGDVDIKSGQSFTITTEIGSLISAYRFALNDGAELPIRQNQYTLKLTYDVTHLKVRCGTADAISNGTLPVKISKTGIMEDVDYLNGEVKTLKEETNVLDKKVAFVDNANGWWNSEGRFMENTSLSGTKKFRVIPNNIYKVFGDEKALRVYFWDKEDNFISYGNLKNFQFTAVENAFYAAIVLEYHEFDSIYISDETSVVEKLEKHRETFYLSSDETISSIIKELYIEIPNNYELPDLYVHDLRYRYGTSEQIGLILRDIAGNNIISFGVLGTDVMTEQVVILQDRTDVGLKGYVVIDWVSFENLLNGKTYTNTKTPINSNIVYLNNSPIINSYLLEESIRSELEKVGYVEDLENVIAEEHIVGGYFRYDTGEIVEGFTTYEAYLYKLDKNEKYRISLLTRGTLLAKAVYFDDNKQYIGYQDKNAISGQTYIYDKELLTPIEGAAYVGVSSVTNEANALYKIILTPVSEVTKNNRESSVLFNKKLAAIGDSITHAVLGADIDVSDVYMPKEGYSKKSYMYYIAKMNGASWYNYGISGSTLGDCYAIGASRNGFSAENGRYTQMADDLDYIVIMFGANDGDYGRWMKMEEYIQNKYGTYHMFPAKGHTIGEDGVMTQEEYNDVMSVSGEINGVTLKGDEYWQAVYTGTIDDETNKTWYGAWNTVIPYLIQKYPKAKILIWLPPTVYKFIEETKRICEKWGIPYLDMHDVQNPTIWKRKELENTLINGVSMNSYVAGRGLTKRDIYTADGVHPNDDGYKYIYPIIESKLKSI